jgi:hypothetical protein
MPRGTAQREAALRVVYRDVLAPSFMPQQGIHRLFSCPQQHAASRNSEIAVSAVPQPCIIIPFPAHAIRRIAPRPEPMVRVEQRRVMPERSDFAAKLWDGATMYTHWLGALFLWFIGWPRTA